MDLTRATVEQATQELTKPTEMVSMTVRYNLSGKSTWALKNTCLQIVLLYFYTIFCFNIVRECKGPEIFQMWNEYIVLQIVIYF